MVNRKIINLQHLQISYDEIKHSNLKQKDLHNLSKLEKTNIKNLEIINKDTFDQKNNFFSSRRSIQNKENDYGRNISIIMIK